MSGVLGEEEVRVVADGDVGTAVGQPRARSPLSRPSPTRPRVIGAGPPAGHDLGTDRI
jgi:hypothetical protein